MTEVDITNSSARSFNVYQHLGIPEIWRYTNGSVKIFRFCLASCFASDIFAVIHTVISNKIKSSIYIRDRLANAVA